MIHPVQEDVLPEFRTLPADAVTSLPVSLHYAALLEIVQAISLAKTSGDALEKLFALLHRRYGASALALEIHTDEMTRLQPFGDMNALVVNSGGAGSEGTWRINSLALDHPACPPGRLLIALNPDTQIDPDLLEAAATQLAARIGQETLTRRAEAAEEKAQQRISEVAAIYEIGQAIDQTEHSRLLQLITDRAALLMDAQACSLMVAQGETGSLRIAASHGLPDDALAQEQKIGEGIAGRVAQTEQPMLIVGDQRDPRLEGVLLRPEIGSSMLVPMKNHEGRVLGVLSIRRRRPASDFNDADLKLFSVFATQAAFALNNKQLYDDLKRRAGELLKISTLSRALISTLNLEELLKRVAEDICHVVSFERCCLFLRDPGKPIYVPRTWRGYPDMIGRNPVREGEGAVGMAAKSKRAVSFDAQEVFPAEQEHQRSYLQRKGFARSLGVDSFIAVPILDSKNRCLGIVVADNRSRRAPISLEQKSLLAAFVNQAGIAIENARLYDDMQENLQNIHRLNNETDNVLQSLGAGIVSTDARGMVTRWNRSAEETLRQPAAFFRNSLLTEVIEKLCLPEAEREHLLGMIARVLETGEQLHQHKLTLHPLQQHSMTVDLRMSRIVDHNQERAGVVLTFQDVTKDVQMEAEMEKMRRLADIGQLAAKMAHEVRNALSPIKGAAQIIRLEMEGQSVSTEWPDIIISEVDGLSRLTSEMLDFARPMTLDRRPLIVTELLMGALHSLSSFLQEHHIATNLQLEPDMPELAADPVQLGQVIRNIVMNAAQAMAGGGELRIAAECLPDTREIALHFYDGGVGIATEELERIFRPFVTTKPKGTGLGLPIVQKIVTQHGGRVEVESQVGKGTCFHVLLPLQPPHEMSEVMVEEIPLISGRLSGPFPDN